MSGSGAYVFVRDAGSWHIKSRAKPDACVACVRADAAAILWTEAYRDGYLAGLGAAREAAERSVAKP